MVVSFTPLDVIPMPPEFLLFLMVLVRTRLVSGLEQLWLLGVADMLLAICELGVVGGNGAETPVVAPGESVAGRVRGLFWILPLDS